MAAVKNYTFTSGNKQLKKIKNHPILTEREYNNNTYIDMRHDSYHIISNDNIIRFITAIDSGRMPIITYWTTSRVQLTFLNR